MLSYFFIESIRIDFLERVWSLVNLFLSSLSYSLFLLLDLLLLPLPLLLFFFLSLKKESFYCLSIFCFKSLTCFWVSDKLFNFYNMSSLEIYVPFVPSNSALFIEHIVLGRMVLLISGLNARLSLRLFFLFLSLLSIPTSSESLGREDS